MRKYFVLHFCMVISAMTFAQLPLTEIEALKDFYDATGGPNWNSETDVDPLNNWNFATPLAATVVSNDWYGITLNGAGTNVSGITMNPTSLLVNRNNLVGTLPASIANLSELRTLSLEIEELSGVIPASITSMVNLTTLNLRANDFSGGIPNDIDNLADLMVLRLSGNELTGTIPNTVTNLANLQYLDLRGNRLSGTIPFDITNMITLRFLRLGLNQFTGVLYPEFSNLTNLIELGLGNNLLTGVVPPEYANLVNLKLLNLSFNNLTGTLPVSYRNLLNLEIFNVSRNNLSGILPPEYSEITSLRILNLGANDFTGTIPINFSNLTALTYFDVSSNNLTGDLAPEFGSWVNIQRLNFGENQFIGNIPETYAAFTNLGHFNVADNLMQGVLSPAFSVWTSLRIFSVQDNNFSGVLPTEYSQWAALENLNVSNNDFEGAFPDFSAQTDLFIVFIDNNNFQFGDFEDQFNAYSTISAFVDSPQAMVNDIENISTCVGGAITLQTVVSGNANVYEWFKNGTALPSSNTPNYTIANPQTTDAGIYTCTISSTIVTDLVLERNPITLTIDNTGPTANEIENLYVCDTDTDGFETFTIDLTAIEEQVLGGQTGLTVTYFDTLGNPLTFTSTYNNTIANQEDITVRVGAAAGCFDETTFSLVVNPLASANVFSNRDICIGDTYILEPLSANNEYFTGPGKTGDQLNVGDAIAATQTIYVYAETGAGTNACASESSFIVTVSGSAPDNFEDVVVCTSYVLPNLSEGNSYHTMPNGGGVILNEGDEVLQTQTIYIQAASSGCFNETSFTVAVDTVACEDDDSLGLPKYFTPNNDGFSDFWDTSKLAGTGNISIFIFDRYGKLLKQLNPDSESSWDGFYRGSPMPSSDYWFQYIDSDTGKKLTGHFTLKR